MTKVFDAEAYTSMMRSAEGHRAHYLVDYINAILSYIISNETNQIRWEENLEYQAPDPLIPIPTDKMGTYITVGM